LNDTDFLKPETIKSRYPSLSSTANRKKIVDNLQTLENAQYKAMDQKTFESKLPERFFLWNDVPYEKMKSTFNQHNIDKIVNTMKRIEKQYPKTKIMRCVISNTNTFEQSLTQKDESVFSININASQEEIYKQIKKVNKLP
jgi:hypothetical protein